MDAGRGRAVTLRRYLAGAILASLLATIPLALAQPEGEEPPSRPRALTGDLRLESDLRVERGETLVLGPNTTVSGSGRLVVHGTLLAEGSPDQPVRFRVPVYVFETPGSTIAHARFEGVKGFSLLVAAGSVGVEHATFDALGVGDVAVKVMPGERTVELTIEDSVVRGYARSGIDVSGPASVAVARTRVEDSAYGLYALVQATTPLNLHVAGSEFARQSEAHVRLDVIGGGLAASSLTFVGNLFADLVHLEGVEVPQRAALAVLEDPREGASSLARPISIVSSENRYVRNPVGIHLSAARHETAYHFVSAADVYEGNGIGVFAQLASLRIDGAVFTGSLQWDVYVPYAPEEGAPLVTLTNSTYTLARIGVDPGAGAVDTDRDGTIRGAAVAAGAVGVLGVSYVMFKWGVRETLVRLMVIPLYARLRPGDVLANQKRKEILEFVTQNPGAHMRRIGQELALSYGTLTYHIYRLEREGYLVSREEGLFKRFYPTTGGAKPKPGPLPTVLRKVERDILTIIVEEPGLPQIGVANRLGLSRQALHYHIKKLDTQGFITKVAQGRETLLYPREDAVEAVRAANAADAPPIASPAAAEPAPASGGGSPTGDGRTL